MLARRAVTVAVLATSTALIWPIPSAVGHEPRSFEACTVQEPGSCMSIGAAFIYGDRVVVRGKVRPTHAGRVARVLRRDPHSTDWNVVATVTVSDRGRMRFVWETTRDDAVQDAPYLFRFRIPGHGRSNTTEAFVLFGE